MSLRPSCLDFSIALNSSSHAIRINPMNDAVGKARNKKKKA